MTIAIILLMVSFLGCSEQSNFLPGDQTEADGWNVGSCYKMISNSPFSEKDLICKVENIRMGGRDDDTAET